MSKRSVLRIAAAIAVTGTTIGFVAVAIVDALRTDIDFPPVQWGFLVPAVVLQIGALFALPWLWVRVLGAGTVREKRFPVSQLLLAYSRSWLARYVPGRVWYVGGRTALAYRQGVDAIPLGRSIFLEIVLSYGTFTLLGLGLALAALSNALAGATFVAIACLILGLVLPSMQSGVHRAAAMLTRLPLLRRLAADGEGNVRLTVRASVGLTLAYACQSTVQVGSFVLIVWGVLDVPSSDLPAIAAAWVISGVIGYVSFVAPAGLGVREAVMLVLLADTLGPAEAALIAAVSRIVLVVSDLTFVAVAEAVAAVRRRQALHAKSVGGIEPRFN